MAKATANCICDTCGSEFVKEKKCYNRREADDWEKWAESNLRECPSCYYKRMAAEERAKPFSIKVKLDITTPAFVFTAAGDSYPHKDDLKEIGYRYGDEPASGFFGLLSTKRPRKVWYKVVKLDVDAREVDDLMKAVKEEVDKAVFIGAEFINEITEVDYAACLHYNEIKRKDEEKRAAKKAEEESKEAEIQEKIKAAIDAIEKPERPACLPTGKWNKTIYGKRTYSIYVDGEKIDITKEQKEEIESWLKAMEEYKKEKERIEEKIRNAEN